MRVDKKLEQWAKEQKAFIEFMFGQTVDAGPDGKVNYYECDVENFLHKLKTGKLLFFDQLSTGS